MFIQSGNPQYNAYVERLDPDRSLFGGHYLFEKIDEVQQ
jgi:hypothetical protein